MEAENQKSGSPIDSASGEAVIVDDKCKREREHMERQEARKTEEGLVLLFYNNHLVKTNWISLKPTLILSEVSTPNDLLLGCTS